MGELVQKQIEELKAKIAADGMQQFGPSTVDVAHLSALYEAENERLSEILKVQWAQYTDEKAENERLKALNAELVGALQGLHAAVGKIKPVKAARRAIQKAKSEAS